ncbi:MAG: peptide deformylase [Candidatus Moranbacteria bacterium]|nr:peptide deformylase [Candidatus Moranbacteria bacterium]
MLDIVTTESSDRDMLRKKAARVIDPTASEVRALVSEMVEAMRVYDGVGLAAPQIGRPIRLFVIEVGGRVSVFFNPKIVSYSEETSVSEEGCLSVPGQYFMIQRPRSITMEYEDTDGKVRSIDAEGFLAVVLQHEYDHLDGILVIDRFMNQK